MTTHRRKGITSRREERHRLTKPRAEREASRIREYWKSQGLQVGVWIEPIYLDEVREWVVRSSVTPRRPA
jgi:hypothetical protein